MNTFKLLNIILYYINEIIQIQIIKIKLIYFLGVRTVPFLRSSENLFCNNCQRIVPTQVSFQSGTGTWFSAGIVALFGC